MRKNNSLYTNTVQEILPKYPLFPSIAADDILDTAAMKAKIIKAKK